MFLKTKMMILMEKKT